MTAPAAAKPKVLEPRDWRLSERIAPAARDPKANEGLRGLLVRRLDRGLKAVWRVGLRSDRTSVYCEPCDRWQLVPPDELYDLWQCGRCRRSYEVEAIIYSEVEP